MVSLTTTAPRRLVAPEAQRLWLLAARVLWFSLGVACGIKALVSPEIHTVYTAFSGATHDWWSNQSLYFQRAYYYSPTFAVLLTPLAIWSNAIGGILWAAASVTLLWLGLRHFYRVVLPSHGWPAASEGKFLLIALVGSVRSFWSAQSNALLIAMVLLGAVAIVRGKWWRGAWWLAAPIHIKVWPLAVAGLFGAQWARRLAARLPVAVVGLGLIPFLTKPPAMVIQQYVGWYQCLFQRQAGVIRFTGYRDAWTIWEKLFSPVNPHTYMLVQAAGAAAALAWCLWRQWRGATVRQQVVITIGVWSAWQLMLGPGTERLTYILVAPSLAWATVASYSAGRGRFWITLALITTYIFDLTGLERMTVSAWPAVLIVQPCGVIFFLGWLLRYGSCAELWPSEALEPVVTQPVSKELMIEDEQTAVEEPLVWHTVIRREQSAAAIASLLATQLTESPRLTEPALPSLNQEPEATSQNL